MNYSRDFVSENPDFRFLKVSEQDGVFKKCLKVVAACLTSSIGFTVKHSVSIRRYVSLASNDKDVGTIERMRVMTREKNGAPSCLGIIHTDNGAMISHVDTAVLQKKLEEIIRCWTIQHSPPGRNTHRDAGYYKKLLRIKILLDHVKNIYADKYNVYQAAYVHKGYSFRASLCFVMQIVSALALVRQPEDASVNRSRDLEDYLFIVVTVLYMFFNIPANYVTSNVSHGFILLNVFYELGMYSRMVFVMMDMIINNLLMSFIPIISSRLLSGTTRSTEIITRSLSVMFITSLDDQAITKGESNRFMEPQESFLQEMLERVDQCRDSDRLYFLTYIPWIENLVLLASVLCAYYILFT